MANKPSMKPNGPSILTINGGSSSIKVAWFETGDSPRQILEVAFERIGLWGGVNRADDVARRVTAPGHTVAVGTGWIRFLRAAPRQP